MRRTAITLAMTLTPALLFAQASVTAKTDVSADAKAQAPHTQASAGAQSSTSATADFEAPSHFSARSRANLEATFRRAREQHVPEQPLRDRVAEGQAKGASEEQILISTNMLESRLAASQQALIRAGHAHPSDAEVERGADAEESGFTSAQVEAVARRTPPDRSVVVALDALTKLVARGVPTTQAVAQVQSRLDAGASDEALASLAASGNAAAGATANVGNGAATGANVAGNAAAGVNAAARGTGAATGAVTGAVGGSVTGALGVHKP